ncbi:MAG TPA: hypothetical protein PKA64_13025, partial [Myxococcota bacterium]|nr:hypothetical protein [Myxococcota bacterium]
MLSLVSILSWGALAGVAEAAQIRWNAPFDVYTPAAVLNSGVTVDAYNATPFTTANVAIHGVDFASGTAIFGQTYPNTPLDGLSTGYRDLDVLLGGFDHSANMSDVIQIGAGRLTPQGLYAVQVFYTDIRSCCLGRAMTFDDRQGHAVTIGGGGGRSFGQSAIGYFLATGTSEDLLLQGNGVESHITGYQVRRIPEGTIVPQTPPTGGARADFDVLGLTAGDDVVLVGGRAVGQTPVPGCPGASVGLQRPIVLGRATAGASG